MLNFLSTFLQTFFWPFGLAIECLVITLLAQRYGKTRWATYAPIVALVLLWIPSLPFVSGGMLGSLEETYLSKPITQYPTADVIVVLGGTTGPRIAPRFEAEEIKGSRLLPAARLFKANKATRILVTSGLSYAVSENVRRTEADDMKELLIDFAIPESAILLEQTSRNTFESARESAKLMRTRGWKRILLVTSAFHLPRAVPLFAREGLDVVPVPTDHHYVRKNLDWTSFFPSASALSRFSLALKEYVGYFAYVSPGVIARFVPDRSQPVSSEQLATMK